MTTPEPTPEAVEALTWNSTFKVAINKAIDDFRMGRRSNDGIAEDIARAVIGAGYIPKESLVEQAEQLEAAIFVRDQLIESLESGS